MRRFHTLRNFNAVQPDRLSKLPSGNVWAGDFDVKFSIGITNFGERLHRHGAVMPAYAMSGANTDEPLRLQEDAELGGTYVGDMIVPFGVTLVLRGTARSDVIVEKGGRAIIHGTIFGCLINLGGDAEVFGAVGVIADAPGVSTRIQKGAVILG